MGPPSPRSSTRRSARTSSGWPRASRSVRRSSRASRAAASRTASSTPPSTNWRAACSRAGCAAGDRLGIWAPNRFEWTLVQYATREARRHPRQHQSGLRLVRGRATRCSSRDAARSSPRRASATATTSPCSPRCARRCPRSSGRRGSTPTAGTSCSPAAASPSRSPPSRERSRGCTPTTRSTSSTRAARPASRRAPTLTHHNILNNGYLVGEACRYSELDRICIPVPFYHCFGMVMGNLACDHARRVHGHPERRLRRRRDARRRSRTSAARRSTACRRCSSPSSPIRASPSTTSRRCAPASWPARRARSRSCGACVDEMHMAEVTICYGMTETSPVSTQSSPDDPLELRVSTVGRVHPHLEIKLVDPATGAHRGARRAGRAVHARLLGDARLLERRGAHRARRSTATAGCTPAISRRWTSTATSTSSAASRT